MSDMSRYVLVPTSTAREWWQVHDLHDFAYPLTEPARFESAAQVADEWNRGGTA